MYRNPVIDADYSDPDVCRVGNDYYMTSSSFPVFPRLADSAQYRPGKLGDPMVLPYSMTILYCLSIRAQTWTGARKSPMATMCGLRLSAITTDGSTSIAATQTRVSLMTKTQDPRGPWEPITWVMKGKGLIDCCPLWDEDGKAYLRMAAQVQEPASNRCSS